MPLLTPGLYRRYSGTTGKVHGGYLSGTAMRPLEFAVYCLRVSLPIDEVFQCRRICEPENPILLNTGAPQLCSDARSAGIAVEDVGDEPQP